MRPSTITHDEARALMPDALRERLDETSRHQLETHLQACGVCAADMEELRSTWELLGQLPEPQPSRSLRTRTLEVARAYVQGERTGRHSNLLDAVDRLIASVWPRRPVWQAAIAAVILLAGWFAGSRSNNDAGEVDRLRAEVSVMSRMLAVSMLQQQSASDRLKGVSMTSRLGRADDEVTGALLDALKFDPNVNVRLAALEALSTSASRPDVRAEMTAWLPRQNSPLVQLAMVDVLADHRDASIDEAFSKLLNGKNVNPTVVERVRMVVGERP